MSSSDPDQAAILPIDPLSNENTPETTGQSAGDAAKAVATAEEGAAPVSYTHLTLPTKRIV